jgi:hypothetical protein
MKKTFFFLLVVFFLSDIYSGAQLSKFVKNVSKSVQKDLTGDQNKNSGKKALPEPASACDQAELILDLGGKLKVDYSEISITSADDGSILVQEYNSGNYYIAKDGVVQGPFKKEDPKIQAFGIIDEKSGSSDFLIKYRQYITKSGEKFLITFLGKKYGPYALINMFAVSKSKEKFAASVTENVAVTEDKAKKMEAAMKNAKTDEEKINLSIQFARDMQSDMGNVTQESYIPKFITNIEGATYDPMKSIGGQFSGDFKYDDILLYNYDKIMDFKGNTIYSGDHNAIDPQGFFINTDNTRTASYNYGTLTFNDKTTLPEVFNPHWVKTDGKVFLAYMYYSPKRNAIMQCKIAF